MNEESKSKIDSITWNTGTNGTNDFTSASNGLSKHFYTHERSNNNGKICTSELFCNDNAIRNTIWNGLVGLMSPSDYGYATSGGSTTNRESCLNKELSGWHESANNDCKNNDWLYNASNSQWTLTPNTDSIYAYFTFFLISRGDVSYSIIDTAYAVRPSVYLTSVTKVSGGDGSQSNPYTLK